MKTIAIILVTLITFASADNPTDSIQRWIKLGDVTLTNKLDNESIILAGNENCKTIKFKALNAAVQVKSLELYYESGDMQSLDKKFTIDRGMESEVISPKAGQKLKKIVFYYKLFAGKENEEVLMELYGSK